MYPLETDRVTENTMLKTNVGRSVEQRCSLGKEPGAFALGGPGPSPLDRDVGGQLKVD